MNNTLFVLLAALIGGGGAGSAPHEIAVAQVTVLEAPGRGVPSNVLGIDASGKRFRVRQTAGDGTLRIDPAAMLPRDTQLVAYPLDPYLYQPSPPSDVAEQVTLQVARRSGLLENEKIRKLLSSAVTYAGERDLIAAARAYSALADELLSHQDTSSQAAGRDARLLAFAEVASALEIHGVSSSDGPHGPQMAPELTQAVKDVQERHGAKVTGELDTETIALLDRPLPQRFPNKQHQEHFGSSDKILVELTVPDDRVKFSFNQAKLPTEASAVLDELAERVRSIGQNYYVEIEGHTDNIGSADYNMRLGEMRAMAIRNYLVEKGIPLEAMQVISYGEEKAVASNSTRDGRAQNRRIVIRVVEAQ